MSFVQSPARAAFLSFVLPGLGQLSLGSARRAFLISLPAMGILFAVVGLLLAGGGALLEVLLRPEILVALLVLNVVLAGYHVIAVVDAFGLASRAHTNHPLARRTSILVLIVVLVGTFSLHGAIEAIGYQAYETMERVFRSLRAGRWLVDPRAELRAGADRVRVALAVFNAAADAVGRRHRVALPQRGA